MNMAVIALSWDLASTIINHGATHDDDYYIHQNIVPMDISYSNDLDEDHWVAVGQTVAPEWNDYINDNDVGVGWTNTPFNPEILPSPSERRRVQPTLTINGECRREHFRQLNADVDIMIAAIAARYKPVVVEELPREPPTAEVTMVRYKLVIVEEVQEKEVPKPPKATVKYRRRRYIQKKGLRAITHQNRHQISDLSPYPKDIVCPNAYST